MDSSEALKVVADRVARLEPEHVARKIIGYVFFQGLSDQEMIRLALGPDSLIHNLIQKGKNARLFPPSEDVSPPISPRTPTMNPTPLPDPFAPPFPSVSPRPFPSPSPFRRVEPYWDPQLPVEPTMQKASLKHMPYSECIGLKDHLDAVNPGPSSFPNDCFFPEAAFNSLSIRGGRNASNLMDFPVKTCQYFIKGFCKHGSNCRYFHGDTFPESYPHGFGPNSYDVAGDDPGFSPGSLEKLEYEITELLKSRRGTPVSIASLPMLYYEKYGETLQAEGYLTESQRHGKAGYSLTKLLARLKNSIRLIDRPHGQHAVILAEDAAKYMDIRAERNDPGPIVNGSRQIYMTFPAESTFTEEDVSTYFRQFGPVHDVRIPCQQKRMFGFVTFVNADTVKVILSMPNPHLVCGARVLVKPYREKTKLADRKYTDKYDHPVFFQSHHTDIDSDLQMCWDSSMLLSNQLMDHEAMRFAQHQLASRPLTDYSMNELKVPQGRPKFLSKVHFNYLFDVLNSGSTSDDHESSQGVNFPDSPFASVVTSNLSAVI